MRRATTGSESWTLNKDIAKWLAAIERKALRRMFGEVTANENWREQCNKELLQLFGDLDILPYARIIWLNWIGHVNRMYSKRKVSQSFNNNSHWIRLRGRPKKMVKLCKKCIKNCRLKTGKRSKKTELNGRSPSWRRRSALGCSTI
jgi:hypothetical protein